MKNNSTYKSVCDLSIEPAFMFELSEQMQSMNSPDIELVGPSTSQTITYPEHHVQAGTFFGNIDLDDLSYYDSLRKTI